MGRGGGGKEQGVSSQLNRLLQYFYQKLKPSDIEGSLILRFLSPSVFDHFQYASTEGKSLRDTYNHMVDSPP